MKGVEKKWVARGLLRRSAKGDWRILRDCLRRFRSVDAAKVLAWEAFQTGDTRLGGRLLRDYFPEATYRLSDTVLRATQSAGPRIEARAHPVARMRSEGGRFTGPPFASCRVAR